MSYTDFDDTKSCESKSKNKHKMPAKSFEYDCTKKCCYRPHAKAITSALTKRSIPDDKLAAFIAKSCCNFENIADEFGRTALHLAASVDRYAILKWLINQGACLKSRDLESGSTPLHRAIYYGCIDCAVLLMRYGADLHMLDEDKRCALQNVCQPGGVCEFLDRKPNVNSANDLLIWGSNKNYNLGIGSASDTTTTPQTIEVFRKQHISIEKIALGAFHSLFLDRKSQLYTVGHGKGGRLGNGNENSQPIPKKVKVPLKNTGEKIICISASRFHSLILTDQSKVFACGINENRQLGVRDAGDKLTVFKEVVTLRDFEVKDLVAVIARDEHSLAYSESCIYIWGTNNGQMNLEESVKIVPMPKLMRLPPRTCVNFVESNDSAVVVVTKDNIALLFYNYKMKHIKTPNFEGLKSVSVIGGDSAKCVKGNAKALKLLLLTKTNVIFLWYEMKQQFLRCIFSQIPITQIDKILYSANQVVILSQGDVFLGKFNQIKIPICEREDEEDMSVTRMIMNTWSRCENVQTEISQEYMIRIDLYRSPYIDRAVDIFCDNDFSSFAVLQESNMKYFRVPPLTREEYTFKKLFNEADIHDNIHDLVFHVDGKAYPAHKFIVYSRAPGLHADISKCTDKDVYLNYPALNTTIFDLVMKYMYLNYFPTEADLTDIQRSFGIESERSLHDICELFLQFVDQFQMTNLEMYLRNFVQHPPASAFQLPDKSKYPFTRLRLKDLPELYDLRIVCAENEIIQAHKCILVARLEYFQMMFSHSWAEQSVITLNTIPVEYMLPIIEFLYSSDVENFRRQNYSEKFLYTMIIYCDQFFIDRLRTICELLVLDKISIRKCSDMLDFACIYNCEVLKNGCMDFICQNLARVLHYRILDNCEPEALKCLNEHYRNMFKTIFDYRMITPDSEAVDDDLLLSFVDDFQVDLEYEMDQQEEEKIANKSKSRDQKNYGAHQYERDAISTMLESLKLAKNSEANTSAQSQVILEAQKVDEKLQENAKNWMKVVDKKDLKKKSALDTALKINETLRSEEKSKPQLVPLKKSNVQSAPTRQKTPEKEIAVTTNKLKTPAKSDKNATPIYDDTPSPSSKTYNFNLADLKATPKLSQKQRKRISSGSEANQSTSDDTLGKLVGSTMPIAVPTPANAWGTLPQSPPSSVMYGSTPPTGSSADPTSFANMARRRSDLQTTTPPQQPGNCNNFFDILEDEQRQRENYERMRNKPLLLTQIEEQAIAELKVFYNVDSPTDEIITIERAPMPMTMNFAVWQRH